MDATAETCTALHLWSQIVGEYRLARTPWHATLYLDARGFTTSLVPDAALGVEVVLDLLDHPVIGSATDGRTARVPLLGCPWRRFTRASLI